MSFNNLIYDKCATEQRLRTSVAPGNYNMYAGQFVNNARCRPPFGAFADYGVSQYNGNIVDLESNLLGIDRRASLCNANQFQANDPRFSSSNLINARTCPNMFERPAPVKAPKFAMPPPTSPFYEQQSLYTRFISWLSGK